jgi:hypothetical protein
MAKSVKINRRDDDFRNPIPDAEWFRKRMDALGLQKVQIAPLFGISPNKLWQMLAGRRRVQIPEALLWAEVLKVPPRTLFEKLGIDWPAATVQVVGQIKADGLIYPLEVAAVAPAPDSASGDLVAVALSVDLPALGLRAGAHFYFAPTDRIDQRADGRLSAVGLGDAGSRPIVGVAEAAGLGRVRVSPITGAPPIESAQAISAAPITWIRSDPS